MKIWGLNTVLTNSFSLYLWEMKNDRNLKECSRYKFTLMLLNSLFGYLKPEIIYAQPSKRFRNESESSHKMYPLYIHSYYSNRKQNKVNAKIQKQCQLCNKRGAYYFCATCTPSTVTSASEIVSIGACCVKDHLKQEHEMQMNKKRSFPSTIKL